MDASKLETANRLHQRITDLRTKLDDVQDPPAVPRLGMTTMEAVNAGERIEMERRRAHAEALRAEFIAALLG